MNFKNLILIFLLITSFYGCDDSVGLDDDAIKIIEGEDSVVDLIFADKINFSISELTFDGFENIPYLNWGIDYKISNGFSSLDTANEILLLNLENYHIEQDIYSPLPRQDSVHTVKFSLKSIPIDLSDSDLRDGVDLNLSSIDFDIEISLLNTQGTKTNLTKNELKLSARYQKGENSDFIKLFLLAEFKGLNTFTQGVHIHSNIYFNCLKEKK